MSTGNVYCDVFAYCKRTVFFPMLVVKKKTLIKSTNTLDYRFVKIH